MPGSLKPIIFLRKMLRELLKPGWVEPKPVYAACSLLILASLMLFTVVISLETGALEKAKELTYSPEVHHSEPIASQPALHQAEKQPSEQAKVEEPVVKPTPIEATPIAASQAPKWPVKGNVNLEFGWHLHPVFNDWRFHPGIDISAVEGTMVQAGLSGRIEDIYTDKNTGLTVIVDSGKYTISYGSLDAVSVSLKKGSYINSGDNIGVVGVSNTEPYTHLHLTIKEGEKYLDPRKVLK
ncbi:M23 family metallopeptidase [bacterium BFN5]|nr:M23 family metallopeptidase [bacterium BFN5]